MISQTKFKGNTNFDLIKSLLNKNKNLKTFIKSAIVFYINIKDIKIIKKHKIYEKVVGNVCTKISS